MEEGSRSVSRAIVCFSARSCEISLNMKLRGLYLENFECGAAGTGDVDEALGMDASGGVYGQADSGALGVGFSTSELF
jgi:hypothetical protein